MASNLCTSRLRKEFKELSKKPVENIRACPLESNILEWHYVIEGAKGSVYEGGYYHGIVTFPKEYPMKPPSIQMFTPNGRFKTCTRLCLSMSDFHPESWNPMWSVGTILMGLYSFMLEELPTYGSISSSSSIRRQNARQSLEYNCRTSTIFCKLFPELKELNDEQLEKISKLPQVTINDSSINGVKSDNTNNDTRSTLIYILGLLIAAISLTYALLAYA